MSKEYRVERKGLSPSEIGEMMGSATPAQKAMSGAPDDFGGVDIKGVPPHLRGLQHPGETPMPRSAHGDGPAPVMPPVAPPGRESVGVTPAAAAAHQHNFYEGVKPPDEGPMIMPVKSPPPLANQQPNAMRGSSFAPTDPEYERLMSALVGRSAKYEEIHLPSKGKFYDGTNGPMSGVLHIRAMTGNEEQILATPRYVKKGKALDMIFRECIAEKQYDPANFLTVDRTYILIYLRGISYTSAYDVEVKCPHCGTGFNTEIDLNLPITECPDDFGQHSLEGVLPSSGFKFTYRLSTGADENIVTEHRERRVKDWGDQAADDTLTFRASLLVTSIEGVRGQPMIQALMQRLPINDVAHIRNLVNDPPFGVETEVNIICPNCSEDFDVEMPLEAHFFFPRRKKEKRQS